MDRRTAKQFVYLVAAELLSDTSRVEAIIEREEFAKNSEDARLLAEEFELFYGELLEHSDDETDLVLQERYKRLEAELEQGDHTQLIERARKSAAFWDEELS